MKITLLTMEYPPDRGGVGNYYFGLVKSLAKKNIHVKVMKFRPGVRWYQILFQLLFIKSDYLWVGQILPIGTAVYIWHKITKQKYFISLHGMDINLAKKNRGLITGKILQAGEFVTVNSKYTADQVDNNVKKVIIYPCPNIDTVIDPEIKRQVISKYNLKNKIILLSVSRLVERKGLQTVINSMKELIDKYPNLIYIIIGSGKYYYHLAQQISNSELDDSVIILRNIDDGELKAFYNIADIFVMPTKQMNEDVEGFGIVYLEAGLFKKPVIATPVGGAKEAVVHNQTGLLVDESEITAAIKRLITDKQLRHELGINGYNQAIKKYSYKKQAVKLINLLND